MEERLLQYIKDWERRCYVDGLPDEAPTEINHLVPSYKKIVVAILKNDTQLQSLGFSPVRGLVYNAIKREEIKNRK